MSKKYSTITVGILLVLVFAGWAMGFFGGTDVEVAELEQLRDKAFKQSESMSVDERRATFGGLRDRVQELSDSQRQQFFERMWPMIQQRINQRLDDFFDMSPEEQRAELDRRIDEMEERGANGGGGPPGGMNQANRGKGMLDRTTPEMRAKVTGMMDMMNKRRNERGLDPIDSPRGMFGAPGGGGR